ncbi:stage III sporulation protein AD [Texcoconibacillus texcoconensis]|uniref:Stage III sporulation protein AD n=1 Tax=Texcoconibacillus texcoconensis TaxID=1095777 RepID=A0A840QNY7_9BACI|nr:stage III sporulation protein AD [Texcoconibacillus texcoconensis]
MVHIEILQIVGLGLVATFLALIVKEHNPSFAFLLTVFVGVIIFIFLAEQIANIVAMLEELAESAQINMVYMETILKIIGIAYIAEFGAQIAKDAGQGAIASKIELGGKVIIMVMAIPIITAIIETVIGLLPN